MSTTVKAKSSSPIDLDLRIPTIDTELKDNESSASSSLRNTSSHRLSPIDQSLDENTSSENKVMREKNISMELAQLFRRLSLDHLQLWPGEGDGNTLGTIDSGHIGSLGHKRKLDGQSKVSGPPKLAHLDCEQLLSGLTQDLVELVSARFSSLGFCQRHNVLLQWFTLSLVQENALGIFDHNSETRTALEHNDYQVRQMLELWFFHHPLSFIVSKSLLLHAYRSGKHDESLLAVILGGARSFMREEESSPGHSLFQWAQSQLCCRSASHLSLSTIQALILLGWHELCSSNPRQSFCYISMSRAAVVDLHNLLRIDHSAEIERINGLDVGKVELELCQRIYWLTFALELWASLQGGLPFPELLPSGVDICFPPLDEVSSAVFNLDKQSNNVATLGAQEKAMRALWPLSYISSTVGYIHALYPREAPQIPSFRNQDWEYQTLSRLKHLIDSPNDIRSVCQKVQYILSDSLDQFESRLSNHPSKVLIVISYRAIIIQLLFPRLDQGSANDAGERALNQLVQSVEAFKKDVQELDQPLESLDSFIDHAESLDASMIVLGLDTCARALDQLYSIQESRRTTESENVMRRYVQLAELSKNLHIMSNHPKLRTVPTAPEVKKNLKRVKRLFEHRSLILSPEDSPWPEQSSTSRFPTPPNSDLPLVGGNGSLAMLPEFMFDSTTINWNWSNRDELYQFTSGNDSGIQP